MGDINKPHFESSELSVIIPAYNEKDAIAATLTALCATSVLDQAEIIVVNDGSTDDTGSQARGFDRVQVIDHLVNRGYGSALRTGLDASTRQYICWL